MSMIWKSAILLAHHGNYTLMDQFVMMGKELALVMFLSLQVVLFLSYQTDCKNFARTIKLSMRHFYLAWSFCNPWAWSMLKALVIHFWWCSKY